MNDKKLGKIVKAKFGYGGYQDVQFGISLTFEGKSWGVSWFMGEWSTEIEVTEHTKWTEKDRSAQFDKTVRKINEILKKAKVDSVEKLVGIPVEVTFDSTLLKDWRVLEEVL